MAKIAFLQNLWHEGLGVMLLASILKKNGHQCEVFIGEKKKLVKSLRKYKPDVIAFSCMVIQYDWVCKVAKFIKTSGIRVPIIVGGPHSTFFPEMVEKPGIDAICVGEGEDAILEFVNAIENKKNVIKIKNLWVKKDNKIFKNAVRPLIENLDELPNPDRNLYTKYKYFRKKPYELFSMSRGCPYNCTFCFNHSFRKLYQNKGRMVRFRDPKKCVEEIKQVKEKSSINLVMFLDSEINLNKQWLFSFLEEYRKEVNLPFTCNIRPNLIDEDIVKALSISNCVSVRFGLESGNEWLRNTILKKQLTDKQAEECVVLFKKYKIPIAVYNMMGIPGETLEMAWQTLELNHKLDPEHYDFDLFIPFSKIELTNYALKEGILRKEDFKKVGRGLHKVFRIFLRQKDTKKVDNLHKFSLIASKYPNLKGIINILIQLPPNKVYDIMYVFTQVINYKKRTGRSLFRLFADVVKNYRALT